MIRVAERHDAARGDDGDGGLADGGDSRAGLNAVEHRHGVFGAERFAVEFLDEHLHSAFRAGLFIEHVLADALGEDAGRFRIGDLLALEQLEHDGGHGGHGLAHAPGAVGCFDDGHFLAVQVDARAFAVHAADHGELEFLGHGGAHGPAGGTVTARIEGRTGDQAVGSIGFHGFHHVGGHVVQMVGTVVVAADEGGHDFGFAVEGGFEGHAGPHDAVPDLGRDVSLVLAADTGKKLIDIMNKLICHDDLLHGAAPVRPGYRVRPPMRLKPSSLVAPRMACNSTSRLPSSRTEPKKPPAMVSAGA